MNYHICNFTLKNYRKFLRLAKNKYEFITYDNNKLDENLCLWRHDVDFSIENAYTLSCIEKEEWLQIPSFIQLSSNIYSVFEPIVFQRIYEKI
jgi:hypothetical protein